MRFLRGCQNVVMMKMNKIPSIDLTNYSKCGIQSLFTNTYHKFHSNHKYGYESNHRSKEDSSYKYRHSQSYGAINDNKLVLCKMVLGFGSFEYLRRNMSLEIVHASGNGDQEMFTSVSDDEFDENGAGIVKQIEVRE